MKLSFAVVICGGKKSASTSHYVVQYRLLSKMRNMRDRVFYNEARRIRYVILDVMMVFRSWKP
jgi:hypothetical protein